MAGLAWEKLKTNQYRLMHSLSPLDAASKIEQRASSEETHGLLIPTFAIMNEVFDSDYALQTLRLGAMLHDIGHPPFSHSGERLMPTYEEVLKANPTLPTFLQDFFKKKFVEEKEKGKTSKVRHEIFSIMMIHKLLEDVYSDPANASLIKISARDVISLIAKEIVPEEGSPMRKHGIYTLCRELISGELDIDRMDYLLRDSRECGVVYGIFDAGRILDSLYLYHSPDDKGLHIAIGFAGLAALEDYLRARNSMYLQLYFHKTAVSSEAMMKHLVKLSKDHLKLPAEVSSYAALDEYNIGSYLKEVSTKSVSPSDAKVFNEMVDNLLYLRKLWKRVYEFIAYKADDEHHGFDLAKRYLEKNGYRFEQVSSANSLTRFYPRKENQKSVNYLRIIKKDETQFPRVYPIEDHSRVINLNQNTFIHRIYAEPKKPLSAIKSEMTEFFKSEGLKG
jgi:HD superfamily phosphohydrolase